ncbi:MAG: hypothetical protein RLZZ262_1681 [Bacteroidota bacterium]|jgi:nicotinamide mononucleotide transporter
MSHSFRLIEIAAVLLNLLFTWLYAQNNSWCFAVGVISPLLYIYITYKRKIYADTFLQCFYIVTTIVGYFRISNEWTPQTIAAPMHLLLIGCLFIVVGICSKWLRARTDAALPSLDSLVTGLAIIGTILMMWPVHACWLYLLAANIFSFLLYANRKLYVSCGMFAIYCWMCIDAYWQLGTLF